MRNYKKQYVQVVTHNDAYFGLIKEDEDEDYLRLHPVDWGNHDMEEDEVLKWKDTLVGRPFIMDIKKKIINTIMILPKAR